jgi:hypothetical protein
MKVVLLCFLLIQMVFPQAQVWYQKNTGSIGPAMSVAVSAQGVIYASVFNKGIYRSLDTGGTWSQIAPYTDGVWSFALRNTGEIVASLWSRGVFRSTDQGNTWIETDSSKQHADVRAVDAQQGIIIEAEGKLFRTTDNGAEWIETSVGGTALAVSGDTVYAAKGTSVFRSTDNGETWSSLTSLSTSSYSLLEENGRLIAGGYCSETSAAPSIHTYDTLTQTWSSGGPRTTINALLRRPQDGMLFAASHDSGFYYSLDQGTVWRQHNNGLSTTKIYSLALLNDTTIIAGTLDGIFFINSKLSAPLPVELTSFKASVRNSIVELRWSTASEVNNHGFEVERKLMVQGSGNTTSNMNHETQNSLWTPVAFVEGAGNSNAPREYSYTDRTISFGIYSFRLKQIDRDGRYSYSHSIDVTIAAGPQRFTLEQNFPNPFNPSTTISYIIPSSGHVSLHVTDLLGREVSRLVNAVQNAGSHSVTLDASSLSSGMYLYTLRSGNLSSTKRMMLVR